MKFCSKCTQANPDDAGFCSQCGTVFDNETAMAVAAADPALESDEIRLWRSFIGPQKAILLSLKKGWSWERPDDYYLNQFKKFSAGGTSRFALTWHWPAFLVDPFLWFLYRKMYLYALIYALGPVLSAYLTGDFTVGFRLASDGGRERQLYLLLACPRAHHRNSQRTPAGPWCVRRTNPGPRRGAILCHLAWHRALRHVVFHRHPNHPRRPTAIRPASTRQGEGHGRCRLHGVVTS
jgi:Predicted membrane protein